MQTIMTRNSGSPPRALLVVTRVLVSYDELRGGIAFEVSIVERWRKPEAGPRLWIVARDDHRAELFRQGAEFAD